MCKAFINFHSSASAPDSHRLPLFSPRQNGPQNHIQLTGKRKSHTGRPSAGVTDCSHILPSFIPFQGCAPGSHMVGILALRISEAHRLPRLYPAFSGFPNDRIAPLRIQTSALTATGIARISTGSLISTPGPLEPSKAWDTMQHLLVKKRISVPYYVRRTRGQENEPVSSSDPLDES